MYKYGMVKRLCVFHLELFDQYITSKQECIIKERREYQASLYVALNVCGELCTWNVNLLTTFSIYVIVYEQSLGFTNKIKHICGDYLHSMRMILRTRLTLRIRTLLYYTLAINEVHV